MNTLSKSKGVKEKVEKIIRENVWGWNCNKCDGGGGNPDKCIECNGTGIHITTIPNWEYELATTKIDKLYRKEGENKIQDLFDSVQFILIEEGVKTRTFDRVLRQFVRVRDNMKVKVLKKMPKSYSSYTCCNLEVNEKAGSEVMCRNCSEWCETKKAE